MDNKDFHWADINASAIIRKKDKLKDSSNVYVCASGITPSGTIHIGNFREIISVDLVVKALLKKSKKVKFIYSWDDYDVFRKVPSNMPNQDKLKEQLRMPITEVIDPYEKEESYARHNEVQIEQELKKVGIHPEYIYQSEKYKASTYAKGMRIALENRDKIKSILNEYRSTPLDDDWYPISIFSNFNQKDNTKVLAWDGEWSVTYKCLDTNKEEKVDLRSCKNVKLLWRVDWPMRWAYEKVDFEPAGKEHHSKGGSFTTAKEIVKLYDFDAPHTFKYDFISMKGLGGKMSSSKGELISLKDFLKIYTPELTRYIFAKYKPNQEFAVSFDLDVIKIYEDYDKCERIFYNLEEGISEKKKNIESRIYELAQVDKALEKAPLQIPFRHLCNLLQINNLKADDVLELIKKEHENLNEENIKLLNSRIFCAINWIKNFAPEDFVFSIFEGKVDLNDEELKILKAFDNGLTEDLSEKDLQNLIYKLAEDFDFEVKSFFQVIYRVLINKTQGPKLGNFIKTIGIKKIKAMLSIY